MHKALLVILLVAVAAIASVIAVQPHQEVKPAPDIAVLTPTGEHRLSSLRGKVVLIDFWGTWCGPCRMSMPAIQSVYAADHPKGFEVLGIALEHEPNAPVRQTLTDLGITYPAGVPKDVNQVKAYDVGSLPLMILVDKKGMQRWHMAGYSPQVEGELEDRVDELLKE